MTELNRSQQVVIGLGLILLMALTRGTHFASIDALPSASWAVFLLAGFFLKQVWFFGLLFLEAVLLDLAALGLDAGIAHCITPAYGMLVPAYLTLWFGGRFYSRIHRDSWSTLAPLVATLLVSAFVSNLFSSGGYYFLSGMFEETSLAGLWTRIEMYLPAKLASLAGYTAVVGGAAWLATRGSEASGARHA
ncbi:hypothetical protein [Marinobacterium mangrovicola]|uniref:Cobalamin ABC transporter n=1 Tax=Marinobacterium mangrovicola TaxID=1476959 RepID=A0A4V2PDC9_9GAMM|nr:hypothetical protein [Marinobacterium mangrovicola]TCK04706.1 hypothetical protein CLV83_3155 [Marinobacterium mangrovicola]